MLKRGRNRSSCQHRGNGKIDHHGLPIPSKVKDIKEFMRLVNSRYACIPGDIRTLPELQAFVDHFSREDNRLVILDKGLDKFGDVVDFWNRVMPDSTKADKVTTRFVLVVAKQLMDKAPPDNLEMMARATGIKLF